MNGKEKSNRQKNLDLKQTLSIKIKIQVRAWEHRKEKKV